MVKAVLKLDLDDEKTKIKAMVIVCGRSGVTSVTMDMTDKKMTVIGDMDPFDVVKKLRKLCCTNIITIGTEKEEAKTPKEKTEDNVVAPYVDSWPSYYPYKVPYTYYY